MNAPRGKVPHFTMRPDPVVTGVLALVLIAGLLTAMSFFAKDEGAGQYTQKGVFTLIVTGILSICLTVLATAKFWFPHLWKKNSTHARHKQHTKHHPVIKDRQQRRSR